MLKGFGWPELLSVQAESGNIKLLLGISATSDQGVCHVSMWECNTHKAAHALVSSESCCSRNSFIHSAAGRQRYEASVSFVLGVVLSAVVLPVRLVETWAEYSFH